MNYVDAFNILGVPVRQKTCVVGEGIPTGSTEGDIGCLYMDENTSDIYKCVSKKNGITTWGTVGLKSEIVRSTNLLDESTVVKGSFYDKGTLTSNQYTSNYHAVSISVAGLSSITISYNMIVSMYAPMLNTYYMVYEDGSGTDITPSNKYMTYYTIEIPENVVEIRFSINSPKLFGTEWNIMINEGIHILPYEKWYTPYTIIPGLDDKFNSVYNSISDVKNIIYPRVILGDTIYAIVNDTIQIFFDSIFDCKLNNLNVMFECSKGKNYPRYWEYTPSAKDVGNHDITVKLIDNNGSVIAEKNSTLVVASASNPSSKVNILCVGDSTMENGNIPIEASRRFKGTTGVTSIPAALSLSNISCVGRKTNNSKTVGWEGTGGWTYGSYNISGYTAIRFTVSSATNLNIGDIYQLGNFKLVVSEINVTNGSGNIRCLFYFSTPYTSSFDNASTSGTMTLYSGNGQNTLSYSVYTKETYQPFWNSDSDKWDITKYRDNYCDGQIDIICILLGINSLISKQPFTEASVDDAKILCRNIHSQLPDCKIVLSTVPPVSPNGGIASNYGASSTIGSYESSVMNKTISNFNLALIEMVESEEFSSYITLANSHAQFDAKNGYPTGTKTVNTRSSITEQIQTNAVHPNDSGYWQLSDALVFRTCLGIINS